MGLIYMRISPSGGKYIGQTICLEEERWKDHVKEALNINSCGYNTYLNRAIRKYGADNFSVNILESNIPEDELDEREIYWIDKYKTYYKDEQHGYNMTRGGSGHCLLKIESEDLLNLWQQGLGTVEIAQYFNCERQAIRERLLSLGLTSKDLTARRTEKAVQTRIQNHYDKDLILTLWANGLSGTQIGQQLHQDRHSITRLLKEWGISDEDMKKRQIMNAVDSTKRAMLQYDKQGNFIQEWESSAAAARALNLQAANIRKVASGERKTTGGYIFKYKENK